MRSQTFQKCSEKAGYIDWVLGNERQQKMSASDIKGGDFRLLHASNFLSVFYVGLRHSVKKNFSEEALGWKMPLDLRHLANGPAWQCVN